MERLVLRGSSALAKLFSLARPRESAKQCRSLANCQNQVSFSSGCSVEAARGGCISSGRMCASGRLPLPRANLPVSARTFRRIGAFPDFGHVPWDSSSGEKEKQKKEPILSASMFARATHCGHAVSLPNMAGRGILSTARARTTLDGAAREHTSHRLRLRFPLRRWCLRIPLHRRRRHRSHRRTLSSAFLNEGYIKTEPFTRRKQLNIGASCGPSHRREVVCLAVSRNIEITREIDGRTSYNNITREGLTKRSISLKKDGKRACVEGDRGLSSS